MSPKSRPLEADRGRRGFTLIEIMISLALLALVMGLVQGVYSGVVRSRDVIQGRTEKSHAAALLLSRMSDELASLVPASEDSSHENVGLVLDQDANLDSVLQFTAFLPAVLQAEKGSDSKSSETGGVALVEYRLERAEDGSRELVRKEVRPEDEKSATASIRDEKGEALLQGVSRFRVKYLLEGETWHESFGGSDSSSQSAAARAVLVEVAWKEAKKGDGPERVLRTTVPLYANWVSK